MLFSLQVRSSVCKYCW